MQVPAAVRVVLIRCTWDCPAPQNEVCVVLFTTPEKRALLAVTGPQGLGVGGAALPQAPQHSSHLPEQHVHRGPETPAAGLSCDTCTMKDPERGVPAQDGLLWWPGQEVELSTSVAEGGGARRGGSTEEDQAMASRGGDKGTVHHHKGCREILQRGPRCRQGCCPGSTTEKQVKEVPVACDLRQKGTTDENKPWENEPWSCLVAQMP